MKKVIIGIIIGVLTISVGLFILGLALADWNIRNIGTGGPFEQKEYITEKNLESLNIDAVNAKVIIIKSEEQNLKIEYEENKYYSYEIIEKEGVLSIKDVTERGLAYAIRVFDPGARIIVHINEQKLGNISINTTNSTILCEEDLTLNSVDFTTTNAKIEMAEITCVSDINLKTKNGKVTASSLTAKNINVFTRNSSIEVECLTAKERISLDNDNGKITTGQVICDMAVKVNTSNGDLDMGMIEAQSINLTTSNADVVALYIRAKSTLIDTSNGDVEINFEGKREQYSVIATTTNGDNNLTSNRDGDMTIDIDTSNGDIEVYFTDEMIVDPPFNGT